MWFGPLDLSVDWRVDCGWMLNSVILGAFCFRAPPDSTVFYFWWFCVKAGGGAQINGRAPFGKETGIFFFLGGGGAGVEVGGGT